MPAYPFKDGKLDTKGIVTPLDISDSKISTGKSYSWSKISGFWVGTHDLFESQPFFLQIGRSESFFLAAIFAELMQLEFSAEAMKDLRGGSVVVRLYAPNTDDPVYYKVQKNLIYGKDLPEERHKAYWVYMLEKAFAFHAMHFDQSHKTLSYVDALNKFTFKESLQMLAGKTKADEMMKWDTPVGKEIKKRTAWTGKDRVDAAMKAIQRLSGLKLFHDYAARAVSLIAYPVFVDQDRFGVCGLASTIFVLLSFQPGRFVDLLQSIFNNEVFTGGISKIKAPVKIHPGQADYKAILKSVVEAPVARDAEAVDINSLLAGRMKEYKKKAADEKLKYWTKLDFIVSRSLAKMLKIINPSLYDEQKDYTKKFLVTGQPLGVKYGDLAFTEIGIQLVLTDVIGVERMRFIPGINEPGPMIAEVNDWFTKMKDNGPFAIAAVNGPSDWIHDGIIPSAKWEPAKQKYEFAHWVVITGQIKDTGMYLIPIWTWGATYNRNLIKDKTAGYLYSVILGCLKPE
jgi:hypothetical protein